LKIIDDRVSLPLRVPGINIATDIICGFPTETEEDFELTMKLVKKYQFNSLFINQFYPRPGTVAAKMEKVPGQQVSKILRDFSLIKVMFF